MSIIRDKKRLKRICIKSLKIGFGSCLAIAIAHFFNLKYEISAGTIALLTILTTKWETIRLSAYRIVMFFVTVLVGWLVHNFIGGGWPEYGICLLIIVFICEITGWTSTLSVNSVIGAHFFTEGDFSPEFIINEFILLLIGISIAIILSFFSSNRSYKKMILKHMEYVENTMHDILSHIASYLRNEPMPGSVWADINQLEDKIKEFIQDASEYNDNSFSDNPKYYMEYFEMRLLQIDELHSLHYEMRRMRSMPVLAEVVAEFLDFMAGCIGKMEMLDVQLDNLHEILSHLKKEAPPATTEEFESRAILYHVLMDIEDFLLIKKRFVDNLELKHRNETFIKE